MCFIISFWTISVPFTCSVVVAKRICLLPRRSSEPLLSHGLVLRQDGVDCVLAALGRRQGKLLSLASQLAARGDVNLQEVFLCCPLRS